MSGRIIRLPLVNLSVTTDSDQDIFRINAGSANKFQLLGFALYSAATTAENVRLRLLRRTTDGTGGGAVTEVLNDEEDSATINAAGTTLVTTPGTAGDVLDEYQWEQLGPLKEVFVPDLRPWVQESGRIALNLLTALGATTVWNGSVWIREY